MTTFPRTPLPRPPRTHVTDDRRVIHVLLDPFLLRTEADALLGAGTVLPLTPLPRTREEVRATGSDYCTYAPSRN